ncbi:HAD family hydrolase [Paenibacillus rhizovicinus]|uniref:HAD family hydrolase n=1 Tax=Paenibacillus rhizovicinus TaxID=2704463 RepID=A0A6C0NVP4_9BACL|nr:HAD-IA family hydrolase [Paenibacillus rhizovicinus]QHW30265.1 HAD family hydrolase [Paenibacillus rhizovicinus]
MAIGGIIFDMDNTILRSNIDFAAMKQEVFDYLLRIGAVNLEIPLHEHTSSSMIALAQRSELWTERMKQELEAILTKHEVAGMMGAELEPGVIALLDQLAGKQKLVILTNNAYPAAKLALETNRIDTYFDRIVAREQMAFMKPAPDGVLAILELYPHIGPQHWLSVGDSWIDGKAAQDARVAFIAYRGDVGRMHSQGVIPAGHIAVMGELLSFIDGSA